MPISLIILIRGLVHFEHWKSPTLSYFWSLYFPHFPHKTPSYPFAHATGYIFSGWYPPRHAFSFRHSTMREELVVFLQYPLLTEITSCPSQIAFSIQL